MKKLFFAFSLLIIFLLTGCTSEISFILNKDGSVTTGFYGAAGKGFTELLKSTTGSKDNNASLFDAKAISKELEKSGFKKVMVICKNKNDIAIDVTDEKKKSEFFTSGLLTVKNNKLSVNLSGDILKKYYESTDEQSAAYLDMLLSPVFSGDTMTESEYLELVSSFYGKAVADEVKNTSIVIEIKNPDGKTTKHTVKMTKLLTLNESLQLE